MRNHLIARLEELAAADPGIVVLTADLGYGVLGSFSGRFPDRCINVGICEQNMAAVAAGLALEGREVYVYSIGNFPTMRCLEQIRNCICYHNANVKTIAVGGGFAYGYLGMTHHATEDIAVMRALPNMRVFCAADPDEAVKILDAAHSVKGPCYIRLARGGEKPLHPQIGEYDVARLLRLRDGADAAIVATGPVLSEAIDAAGELAPGGISAGVFGCMALKPFDSAGLRDLAERFRVVVSVEEHNVTGGLGSAIAESLLSEPPSKMPRFARLGLQDEYTDVAGSIPFLRKRYGISSGDIAKTVKEML